MADSAFAPLSQKARTFLKDTKGNDAVISTARTQTNFLDDPCLCENLSGDDFRFIDLKREKMTVYIVLPMKLIFAYSRWFRLLVVSGMDALMGTEEKAEKPVLFMLDEFPILGHLSCIETAMGLARGFGVQLWPFLQDIHQLRDIYSKRADSFFANAGIQQFFTPVDMETAKHLSERCGNTSILAKNAGNSSGSNEQQNGGGTSASTGQSEGYSERSKPLFYPAQLLDMPKTVQMLFVAGYSDPLVISRLPYYLRDNTRSECIDKNPYL
jgi:type IV secretion system protein VirD4